MKVGLVDVDSHNYPNLALMKISAWHKSQGDSVEWYQPLLSGHMDKVYMSKVFSFSNDFDWIIDADEIIKGGTGYAITTIEGVEYYDKSKDMVLPEPIEHIYPDYSLYPQMTGFGKPLKEQTAYGFLSRGCPRMCAFCHVSSKEGCKSYKVANLDEFWRGQKHIELLDPNTLACNDWREILQQLINSKARVNFNQGLDIRMMTDEKADMLTQIKLDAIHFAWDRYADKEKIQPKFEMFRRKSKVRNKDLQVYVLCGDRKQCVMPEDLERIYWLRDAGFAPYVMLYNKDEIPKGSDLLKLQRWVNNRFVFWKTSTFEDYLKGNK